MEKYKKYIVYFIGEIIFVFGICFGVKSLLGGNSLSVFVVGINKHVSLSLGTCNLIVALIQILIGYILDKKNVTWVTFVASFSCSYLIDFGNFVIPGTTNLVIKVIYMLFGLVIYCLGLGMMQYANIGYENFDVFIFGLKKVFKIEKYHTIKWIIDGILIVLGYLLGAEVGVGTLLLLVFAGILIEKFKELTVKIVK